MQGAANTKQLSVFCLVLQRDFGNRGLAGAAFQLRFWEQFHDAFRISTLSAIHQNAQSLVVVLGSF